MGSAWDRIGDSDMGPIKQGLLSEYRNIKKFLEEMPASNDPESKKLVSKAESILREGFGLNKRTASILDEALADPETRAALIRLSKEKPEALSETLDRIKENPPEAKIILTEVIANNRQIPDRAEAPSPAAGSPEASPSHNKPSAIAQFLDKVATFFSEKFEAIVVAIKDMFSSNKDRTPGNEDSPAQPPILTTREKELLGQSLKNLNQSEISSLAANLKEMGVKPTPPETLHITAGYKAKHAATVEVS